LGSKKPRLNKNALTNTLSPLPSERVFYFRNRHKETKAEKLKLKENGKLKIVFPHGLHGFTQMIDDRNQR
jgi:hypothetical protein